jgi:hypothetical protein
VSSINFKFKKELSGLNDWAQGIEEIIKKSNLDGFNLNIGIKTFVTDSYWREFELK